jgi:lipopolysaccharide transport system ATP-binding protein
MSDVVINVENIWKEYRLGTVSHHSMAKDLQSWWARMRGKEDPNAQVGSNSQFTHHPSQSKNSPSTPHPSQGEAPDRFWALQDISFEVKRGDVLGIIGRNGAGKSTLLKILSKVTTPTRGQVTYKGRIASLLEVGTGFHPELTGRENIFLNGAILGMGKEEIKRKFDEIVAFAEVDAFIDTPVKRYSSGMYVRLAFAVAAHLEPEILIIDEVLAVGDAQFQNKCLGKMEAVGKEGRTVLFVSHNMNSISRLCSKAILLSEGQVHIYDEASVVLSRYMRTNSGLVGTVVQFPDNPDKKWQILSVSLLRQNGQMVREPIDINEPFEIVISYRMSCLLQGAYGVLIIKNKYDEIIFFSDSRDSGNSASLEMLGTIDLSVGIPLPLLVPGEYFITVSIARAPTGTIDLVKDGVRFEIYDNSGVRANRSGHVYVPLKWKLKR